MNSATFNFPSIIAHRGGGCLAPENTLAAMHKAVELGFKAVEFDVMLAACGTPIIIHDETLERTTNGVGRVADKTYAEISKLDAGAWFAEEFIGERVPTFEEVAKYCIEAKLQPNIEIKPSKGAELKTGKIVAELTTAWWKDIAIKPLISSFSEEALAAAYKTAPELIYSFLFERIPENWQVKVKKFDCVSLECSKQYLSPQQVTEVKNAGYGLLVYTVNEVNQAKQFFAWGVDGIFTDQLDLIAPDF